MEQQGACLAELTNQSVELLSHDICSRHQSAEELREQVCGNESMREWENGNLCVSGIGT